MGYRYTMVDYNPFESEYELRCYINDECVLTKYFNSNDEALNYGDKFLNKELEVELMVS